MANLKAEVSLTWGDGEYLFALKIAEIEELQKACDAGFGEIAARVFGNLFYIRDVYEIIRLGLIGGGMAPVTAKQKVRLLCQLSAARRDGGPVVATEDREGHPSSRATSALKTCRWMSREKKTRPRRQLDRRPAFRAQALRAGWPTDDFDRSSLYRVLSTLPVYWRLLSGQAEMMSDEDYDDLLNDIRALNLPDVRI